MLRLSILSLFLLIMSCKKDKKEMIQQVITVDYLKKNDSISQHEQWFNKDIIDDSIAGASFDKLVNESNNSNNETEVVIAVIDSELNIDNQLFNNRIWINKNEINNNNIDDDGNGYVDDINGWNFLGSTIKDSLSASNHEAVRIVRKYKAEFIGSDSIAKRNEMPNEYDKYNRARNELEIKLNEAEENYQYFIGFRERYLSLTDTLGTILNTKNITLKALDSLNKSSEDSILIKKINSMKYCIENNIDKPWLDDVILYHKLNKNKVYNLDYYNDRLTKDDPFNINDNSYGNNNIEGTHKIDHATEVSSLILSIFNDKIAHNIKVMPIVVSTRGSEYDKDIALAIRYAVNNGAKVINMSIGKDFSLNEDWISEAIEYAESKDVLIVSAAGNESLNLDNSEVYYYPNDMNSSKEEIVNNFLVVGSSNNTKNLVSEFSNYGKEVVDIFAPGEEIKVLTRNESINDSGTSLSTAIVSNLAGLILLKFDNLSSAEVKNIIMESGVSYDFIVNLPVPYGKEATKAPFSSLSKSGKIVNAYNALLMAEEISKKKKKNK